MGHYAWKQGERTFHVKTQLKALPLIYSSTLTIKLLHVKAQCESIAFKKLFSFYLTKIQAIKYKKTMMLVLKLVANLENVISIEFMF